MSLFGPKNYDSIVRSLSKLADNLTKHADYHAREGDVKRAEAVILQTEADGHDAAAIKSRATAAKISDLIS